MDKIISQVVLNKTTGELETQDLRVLKPTSKIKGGYRMMYKNYDEIQSELLKSNLDIRIFLYIRDKFSRTRIETSISARAIANELNTTPSKVSTLIKQLVENNFLMRVDRGIYRMNPFMFIPYGSPAEELQKEWEKLKEEQ